MCKITLNSWIYILKKCTKMDNRSAFWTLSGKLWIYSGVDWHPACQQGMSLE